MAVEPAVYAGIGARVGDVQGYVHSDGAPEAHLRQLSAAQCHLFEIWGGGRGYKGHEVLNAGIAG